MAALALLAGCGRSQPAVDPPGREFVAARIVSPAGIWTRATIALPVRGSVGSLLTTNDGSAVVSSLAGAGPNTRWPVILLLPGCHGPVSLALLRAFAEQGYVALALPGIYGPDDCDGTRAPSERASRSTGRWHNVITFARARLEQSSWVDRAHIFLAGHGEAAAAVAGYPAGGFRARLLAEWHCGDDDAGAGGIAREAVSPVFAVTSARTPTLGGGCRRFFSDAGASTMLELPQLYARDILLEPIVFTQTLQFLDRQIF